MKIILPRLATAWEDQKAKDDIARAAKELAFDALFQNLPINFYWLDNNGILLGCNQEVADALNYRYVDEIIGKHASEIVMPEGWENCKKVLLTGEVLSVEEVHVTSEGEEITFLSIKSPIFDKKNNITGLVGVSINISERKKMEKELLTARLAAEAANQAKSEFLINMSHDIRTPLNGMLGFAQIMLGQEENIEKKENLNIILDSGWKLLNLLNEIIEISNLEANHLPVKNELFSIKTVLDNLHSLFASGIKQKKLQLSFYLDDKIPEKIIGDTNRLHRILLNLIGNSIKFTESGGINLRVDCQSYLKDKVVLQFLIEDTGIGMPEDKLSVIFERFRRLTLSDQSGYQGTGLGLYIVKKFVEELNGTIEVQSAVGEGSVFKCVIPFAVEAS